MEGLVELLLLTLSEKDPGCSGEFLGLVAEGPGTMATL